MWYSIDKRQNKIALKKYEIILKKLFLHNPSKNQNKIPFFIHLPLLKTEQKSKTW